MQPHILMWSVFDQLHVNVAWGHYVLIYEIATREMVLYSHFHPHLTMSEVDITFLRLRSILLDIGP